MMQRTYAASLWIALLVIGFGCDAAGQPKAERNEGAAGAEQIADYVVELLEDSKGNLWLGTMSRGAVKFDGEGLTYYTTKDGLIGNTVASIAEDLDGNLWFGTHSGASRFDGKAFENFGEAEGLCGAGCQLLVDSKGQIWAGTNGGAFRFAESRFLMFDLPEPEIGELSYKWEAGKVWSLIEDRHGNLWFGRDGFGACRYDGTNFKHFTKDDGLASNNVSTVVEDKDGNIWFGSLSSDAPEYRNEGGVSRYDGKTITRFPSTDGLFENDIYTIGTDRRGNVWIGATGKGAYRFDGNSFELVRDTDHADRIQAFGIQAFLEDSKGRLWFGFSGGLFRLEGSRLVNVARSGPWK